MTRLGAGALATCTLFAASALADANLVANPGFETGDFTGWTQFGNTRPDHSFVCGPNSYPGWDEWLPHSGNHFAALGAANGTGLILMQTLATNPGESYVLGFQLGSDGETPNSFAATWNGSIVLQLDDQSETPGHDLVHGPPAAAYRAYHFAVVATGATTTMSLQSQNEQGWWALDDVSVVPFPEPSASASLGAGMLAVIGCARWRGRRSG